MRTADDSTFSYTLTAASSYTASGSYSDGDYRAGVWSGGSYAFASAVHDESTQDSDSYNSTTTYLYSATGTVVNIRTGISTTGVNGTFAYSASGSETASESGTSSSSEVLHEEGSYSNGSWSLASMAWDASATASSGYSFAGHEQATGAGFTATSDYSGSGNATDSWSLREAGTYSAGCWSLGSLVEQERFVSSDQSTETWSQSATGQSATGTISAAAAETYNFYRAGAYAGGSYSFGSLSLDDRAAGAETVTESGSDATYSSYAREDDYSYRYALHVDGAAQVGTYSEDSLETTTHTFDATLVAGGEQHDSSITTIGYSNSGTVSLASGELAFTGVSVDAPPFPALPPMLDDPSAPDDTAPAAPAGITGPALGAPPGDLAGPGGVGDGAGQTSPPAPGTGNNGEPCSGQDGPRAKEGAGAASQGERPGNNTRGGRSGPTQPPKPPAGGAGGTAMPSGQLPLPRGEGHHWAVRSVLAKYLKYLEDAAARYGFGAISGPTDPPHNFGPVDGVKHSDYNKAVEAEFKEYMKEIKVTDEKGRLIRPMTKDEMKEFIRRIITGENLKNRKRAGLIKKFNDGTKKLAEAAKEANKGRARPLPSDDAAIMERGKASMRKHGIQLGLAILGTVLTGANIIADTKDVADSRYWKDAYNAASRGDIEGVLRALVGDAVKDGPFGNHLFGEIASRLVQQNPLLRDGLIIAYHRLYALLLDFITRYGREFENRFGRSEPPPVVPPPPGPPPGANVDK